MYDELDAAAALGLERDDFNRLVDAGVGEALGALAGGKRGPGGSHLVPVIDADGSRWFSESELARVEQARASGPTPDEVADAEPAAELVEVDERVG